MKKKFFIIGGYTYSNPGDEAILKTTLGRLAGLFPQSHFVISSDKKDFSVHLASSISHEIFLYRRPPIFYRYRLLQQAYRLLFPLSYTIVRFLTPESGRIAQKMSGCDLTVFIGGGYLNSLYNLLQIHYLYRLSKESGRAVYLLGQTVGPFTRKKDRVIAGAIFKGAERIVLREASSLEETSDFGKNAVVGGDDALAFHDHLKPEDFQAIEPYFKRSDGEQILLGLNLRPDGSPDFFYEALVEQLNQFSRETAGGKLRVIFIPMETSVYCDDRREAEKLAAIKGKEFEFQTLTGPLTVENRSAAISKADIFIGMRFHSLIFSLSSGVPCIGLYTSEYYRRKNSGLLEMYGMKKYCLPIDRGLELAQFLGQISRRRAELKAMLKEKHTAILENQSKIYASLF